MGPAREIGSVDWPDDQMNVIRHQARSQDRQRQSFLRAANEREKLGVVSRIVKDLRFLISAIDDVVAVASHNRTRRPWHGQSLVGNRHRWLRQFWPNRQE